MSQDDDYDDEVTAFYRKYVSKVQGYLIKMGTDRGLAEEITDDAFLAARRHWTHVQALDRPEAYIFKIAKNERSKRQKDHDIRARDLQSDPPGPPQHIASDPGQGVPDRLLLEEALHQLPSSLREVITLRDVEDLGVDTTAEIMSISAGAVKRYTFEARRRLRLLLSDFHIKGEGEIGR
jgi:RNA polymerase sigma-70 factor, ECF subfamily